MKTMNSGEILKTLPHRYPMMLVDRVVESDGQNRITAVKNVTINEPFFQGHFPGRPVMPGVLQLEVMAQTAGILLNQRAGLGPRIAYFLGIDKARFRRVVEPGDQLRVEVEFLKVRTQTARFKARILVDGEVASEAELLCMITDEKVE